MTPLDRLFAAVFSPRRLLSAIWKRLGWGSFGLRLRYDALPRAHYAYGIYFAALHARCLGIDRISVIEMGVAGGNGLLVMETHAAAVERELGVKIEVYGFDGATGLPAISDVRDMPYFFRPGDYAMDRPALERRLRSAKLVLGPVRETIESFVTNFRPAPIGFVAFDLDLYSSTVDALRLFDLDDDYLLPRILCYFDDIIGPDLFMNNAWLGELAAIGDFNARSDRQKIAPVFGLAYKRQFPCAWDAQMFSFHRFDHRRYADYLGVPEADASLRARPR